MSYMKEFTKGLLKENPNLVLLLGMCPTLAMSTMAENALGLGLATTFVVVCSNIVISLLKRFIPQQVRLPIYIFTIASFSTFIGIMLSAFLPELYSSLGLFLRLIAVNCIVLARVEVFASKNKVIPSILDGLGMGLGFTGTLLVVGCIRELFGSGTIFGIQFMPDALEPMLIMILPSGGFFVLGVVIAVAGKLMNKKPREIACDSCPAHDACTMCPSKKEVK